MNKERTKAKLELFKCRGMNWFLDDLEKEIECTSVRENVEKLRKIYIEQLKEEEEGKLKQTKFKF